MSDNKVKVILVHGTRARDAPWTQATSLLCRSIITELPSYNVCFEKFLWSGCNTFNARSEAAEQLSERLVADALNDKKIILIGHSHGGSIVAKLLDERPELRTNVVGAVFLSTPFINIRKKPSTDKLDIVLEKWLWMLLGAIVAGGVLALSFFGQLRWFHIALVVTPFFLGTNLLLAKYRGFRIPSSMDEWMSNTWVREERLVRRKIMQLMAQVNIRFIDRDMCLFVRTTGDEASSALAALQTFGSIVDYASLFFIQLAYVFITASDVDTLKDKNIRFGGIFRIVWIALISITLTGIILAKLSILLPSYWFDRLLFILRKASWINVFWLFLIPATLTLATWLLFPVFFAIAGAMMALFARAFGGAPFSFIWPFVQLSVEATPPGRWHLVHIDCKPEELDWRKTIPSLAHSRSYEDPEAIRQVISWIRQRLGENASSHVRPDSP